MIAREILIRQATHDEAGSVATIARQSRMQFLPYLPELHTIEDDRTFYRNVVFAECDVWVAEEDQVLVGFCAFREGWLDHLYLLPAHVGRSIGETLLNKAKESQGQLQLRVFQQNSRAIRFYERNGFRKVKETDGRSNEENIPDALYEWRRLP